MLGNEILKGVAHCTKQEKVIIILVNTQKSEGKITLTHLKIKTMFSKKTIL